MVCNVWSMVYVYINILNYMVYGGWKKGLCHIAWSLVVLGLLERGLGLIIRQVLS